MRLPNGVLNTAKVARRVTKIVTKDAIAQEEKEMQISEDKLIDLIKAAATEQLPVAVMTVNEMRRFAQLVAEECAKIAEMDNMAPVDIARVIRGLYDQTH